MSSLNLNDIEVPADLSFLVLEDTAIFQEKLVESILDLGFKNNISLAGTLKEAYEILETKFPDFILSDWNLPDGVGIDFLKKVRSNPKFDKTPFIMVTTMDAIDDILDAAKLGADDYIIKTWDRKEFSIKISTSYQKRQKL